MVETTNGRPLSLTTTSWMSSNFIASTPQALSVSAATITLTQNILGAGVLALPFACKSAGLLGSLTLLLLIFVLSVLSMATLVLLANQLGDFSYKGLAQRTLGERWSEVAEVWVLCYSLGICISYVVLLGDFLNAFATNFKMDWADQRLCMVVAVVFVCWPLSCARSLGALKYTSSIGVLAIMLGAVAAVKRYADDTYDGPYKNNPEILNGTTFGECFPILVGAFGAHYNIPSLYREVAPDAGAGDVAADKKGFRRMFVVITNSLFLSGILYGIVGISVYLTFGSLTEGDFTQNFHTSDGWMIATRLGMTFAISVTFPLSMVAARSSVLKLLDWPLTLRTQIVLATVLSGFCLLVAVLLKDISLILAYNGSVFGTPVCYIVPMVMYLFMPLSGQTSKGKAFSITCVIIGSLFGILGIVVVTMEKVFKAF